MPTPLDKAIKSRLSHEKEGRILIPILERQLEHPVGIEDEDDIEFMVDLMRARSVPRKKGIFSPSMLGSCMRQAYFVKTGQERQYVPTPRRNAIFLDGDFRHYKWQFVLWKCHRSGYLELLGTEIRVVSRRQPFGGTLDAVVRIPGELNPIVIDFKGMNAQSFIKFLREGMDAYDNYRVQITGYGMLAKANTDWPISKALLIGENKGGPHDAGTSIALHEEAVDISDSRGAVELRLRELNAYAQEHEIPAPACESTTHIQFQECDFAEHCRAEVLAKQRERQAANRQTIGGLKVARTSRRS